MGRRLRRRSVRDRSLGGRGGSLAFRPLEQRVDRVEAPVEKENVAADRPSLVNRDRRARTGAERQKETDGSQKEGADKQEYQRAPFRFQANLPSMMNGSRGKPGRIATCQPPTTRTTITLRFEIAPAFDANKVNPCQIRRRAVFLTAGAELHGGDRQGDGAGVGDVEALDGAGHIEPCENIATLPCEATQAFVFGAEHENHRP